MYCNSWYHIHSSHSHLIILYNFYYCNFVSSITFYHTGTVLFYLVLKYSYPVNMYIMILSIMYYFTNFGDLCDSGSFHLYGFPGSTTHYDKKFILLLLTSYISEIKLFLFLFFLFLTVHEMSVRLPISGSGIITCLGAK